MCFQQSQPGTEDPSRQEEQQKATAGAGGGAGGWQGWVTGWYSWYGTDTTDGSPGKIQGKDAAPAFMGEPPTTKG